MSDEQIGTVDWYDEGKACAQARREMTDVKARVVVGALVDTFEELYKDANSSESMSAAWAEFIRGWNYGLKTA